MAAIKISARHYADNYDSFEHFLQSALLRVFYIVKFT